MPVQQLFFPFQKLFVTTLVFYFEKSLIFALQLVAERIVEK